MTRISGRLVLDRSVGSGTIEVEGGTIASVVTTPEDAADTTAPFITPGFVDVHVHGGGGHDAMGGPAALDGMARHLLRHGVTSFLPTGVSAPLDDLYRFLDDVRDWMPRAPFDGAAPLGSNLEGPWLALAKKGAHDPTLLRSPADLRFEDLEPHLDGLRLVTVAPELPGALELIAWLHERGIATSMGHSAASLEEARAGYATGGSSTTHLFNGMSGVDHHDPGLAVAALTDDDAYVELIADGVHVHPALWRLIARTKPVDRLMLISDAIPLAGMGDGRATIGGLEVEVVGQRVTLVGTATLAGSVIALDTAVQNLVASGITLPNAVAAASRNPLAMLGVTDRGRIAVGQRADLVELDGSLQVRRVMRAGAWLD
jgi:N-acetylglucosamine-6-phosphate deacetylase